MRRKSIGEENSTHKGPVMRKVLPVVTSSCVPLNASRCPSLFQQNVEGNEEEFSRFLRNYEIDKKDNEGGPFNAQPGHIIYVLGYFLRVSIVSDISKYRWVSAGKT